MALYVYNTLTRRKEPFIPRDPGRVAMYFCGPTPYSHTHIGHLRPALTGDVVARYFKYRGYQVFYLSNFTDIDDKIINRSHEEGVPPAEVAARYTREYLEIMEVMGIDQVDRYARVTEHIPEIIDMVRVLVEKGAAYPVDGDVYYDVTSMADYGKLSCRSLDEMQAGARVAVDERKRHPMDFALWKAAKPGEPAWDSPWGPGRPGWHIECSAMSLKYLGNGFDIHGGGDDLIFPHHENEIAQSEAYTGRPPFARYWLHNGMIQINQEKMSKSLGNFVTAREILDRFPPQAVRCFMLSTHYRKPLNFSLQGLEDAARGWERITNTVAHLRHILDGPPAHAGWQQVPSGPAVSLDEKFFRTAIDEARTAFEAAMDDDFNTALALAALFDLAKAANSFTHDPGFRPEGASLRLVADASETLAGLAAVLGFRLEAGASKQSANGNRLVEGLLELVLELRQAARRDKDWATSDLIRDRLGRLGVTVEDTPHGPRWKLS